MDYAGSYPAVQPNFMFLDLILVFVMDCLGKVYRILVPPVHTVIIIRSTGLVLIRYILNDHSFCFLFIVEGPFG